MSLREAYSMAHSAQCRLHMAASRPDRNLRFLVGHLMTYESLRLRIVEIEHDISKNERAKAVAFKGTGHVEQQPRSSSPRLAGRKSPPPPAVEDDGEEDDEDDEDPWSGDEDDDAGDDLGLERFPSGAAQPPRLMPDVDDEGDDEEPISPEEPDQATLEAALQGPGQKDMANLYNGIRKCPCHKNQDAPTFENFWELPADDNGQKEGVTRAVAQVWV